MPITGRLRRSGCSENGTVTRDGGSCEACAAWRDLRRSGILGWEGVLMRQEIGGKARRKRGRPRIFDGRRVHICVPAEMLENLRDYLGPSDANLSAFGRTALREAMSRRGIDLD